MSDYNFGDYREIAPIALHLPHMATLLAADASGSMYGMAINSVNRCINRFKRDICKDDKAASAVDVAVVSFNTEPTVVQNWRPIKELEPVEMSADGGTDISKALDLSIDMTRERCNLYFDSGMEVKKPWIILITDGRDPHIDDVAERVKKRTEEGKLMLWVLAVGDYDKKTIAKLTGGKRVFELKDGADLDFSEFFDFMAVSIKAVSTGAAGDGRVSVKHSIGGEDSNFRVPDLDEWLND